VPSPIVRPLLIVFAVLLIVVGAMRFDLVVTASAAFLISMTTALSVAFSHGAYSQLEKLPGLTRFGPSRRAHRTEPDHYRIARRTRRRERSRGCARSAATRRSSRAVRSRSGCTDRDTGKFLLVNAAATRQYGWSREEFFRAESAILAPPGQPRVLPEPGEEGTERGRRRAATMPRSAAAEPFETRHRTGDGRVLDVEVWTRSIDLAGEPCDAGIRDRRHRAAGVRSSLERGHHW
jgi:PAS domain-containing protein